MRAKEAIAALSRVARDQHGTFSTAQAVAAGAPNKQLSALIAAGALERVLPRVYRLTSVRPSVEQRRHDALLWGGDGAAVAGRSAGEVYRLEAVHAPTPEIIVVPPRRVRCGDGVVVTRVNDPASWMIRRYAGWRVVGVEACLVQLAADLDDEALEIACEDARRRRLTGVPAIRRYLDEYGRRGRDGIVRLRALIDALDPKHPSRSTLEVKMRRLLAASDLPAFLREVPLTWGGRTRYFDFGRPTDKLVLECNSKRWHDDPADYTDYNDKASIPGKLGWTIIFVTWDDVIQRPVKVIADIRGAVSGR